MDQTLRGLLATHVKITFLELLKGLINNLANHGLKFSLDSVKADSKEVFTLFRNKTWT